MKIYVDIDETICYYDNKRDYNLAKPIFDRIKKINDLYETGNEITYYTARGTITGLDWYDITKKQLSIWGCKYHHLSVGQKPAYDLLICDKAVNSELYFRSKK
jgi:CMP-N,N'-diacetyllegionaminic acid synthase